MRCAGTLVAPSGPRAQAWRRLMPANFKSTRWSRKSVAIADAEIEPLEDRLAASNTQTPRGRDRSERRVQCTRRASRLRLEVIWLASRVPAGRCDRVCAPYLCRGPAAACTWMPCDVCGTGCASGVCSTPWRWRLASWWVLESSVGGDRVPCGRVFHRTIRGCWGHGPVANDSELACRMLPRLTLASAPGGRCK